eukprot:4920405-Pleurochrysis_carterae.AAC.1
MENSDTRYSENTRDTGHGGRIQGTRGRSTIHTREADERGNVGRRDGTPSISDCLEGQHCYMG